MSMLSGAYSVLQVVFILQRNTGYFLIQVKTSLDAIHSSDVKWMFYIEVELKF